MSAPPAYHDNVLVYRLVQLLIKFNQGEKLDPQAPAEELGVTRRTLQRDKNELISLPGLQTEMERETRAYLTGSSS